MDVNSPSLVAATSHDGPRSLYGGVHAAGGYGEVPFFTAWMAT
jgi:hypothetical protein